MKRRLLLQSMAAVAAAPVRAQPQRAFLLGLLTQGDDERFAPQALQHGYPMAPGGRAAPAVQLGLDDSAFALQNAGHGNARVAAVEAPDAPGLPGALEQLLRQGVRHVVLQLPAAGVAAVAGASRDKEVILFNAAAPEDALRAAQCAPQLLHTLPSHAMQADAIVQLLVARKWARVLVLTGPTPDDRLLQAAYRRSMKRFGLKALAEKAFKLSNDPRERDLGNVRLLTAEREYDAVLVLDADGEFARDVPYRTVLPRPVLGSSGLTAQAWSFFHERNGAPQLNRRFLKKAGRAMDSFDWAAWMAARAAAEAAGADAKAGVAQQLQALRNGTLAFDGYKGPRVSFRAWDGQLRQPLLLAHGNGVADIAPLDGFLHPRSTLDTLGVDAAESLCR